MHQWWLETSILSISVWNWVLAIGVMALLFFALLSLREYVRARLTRATGKKHTRFLRVLMRAVASTSVVAMLALAILIGVKFLDMPATWHSGLSQLWFVVVVLQVALWLSAAMSFMLQHYMERHPDLNAVTMTIIGFAARAVLWAVAILAVLDNMGINITAFVASLGIGGVAVALAAQVVLSDLFASISIGLDKPFEPGDFIVVGGIAGSIEHVGLKTTRIRSLGGEQIVCSNTELLKQTIQNYKRMELRRIAFTFTVSYGATGAQALEISQAVKALIAGMDGARYDRAHLLKFGERGLEYEVVYYVLSADYNVYMDLQQNINLGIMHEVEQRGLELGRTEMKVRYEGGLPSRSGSSREDRPL